eukprot:3636482-Ditylum_brightwellii.AAC.1
MRSVHKCTDMVVVEDVVDRSECFENEDEWEDKGIFGTSNLEEMNNFDVDIGAEDDWEEDWENRGMFMTSREQIDVNEELWDDDENMNSEES